MGKGLYRINNLVDINNLISLENFTPVGTYDLARISRRVVFRVGKVGESYKGIGKDVINIVDLPVFVDDTGPFGSPTSDSEQAMITERTEQFAMMIISFSGAASLPHWAERAVELVRNHASGDNLILEIVE